MKKKFLKIFTVVLLSMLLIMLTGCGKEKDYEEDEKEKNEATEEIVVEDKVSIVDLIKDENWELIELDKEVESYFNEVEFKKVSDEIYGVLSIAVQDFNGDGEDEAVITKIDDEDNVVLELYANEDGTLELKDTYTILDKLLTKADELDFSIFAKQDGDEVNLYYESNELYNVMSDGTIYNCEKIKVSEDKFDVVDKVNHEGSYIEDTNELIKKVNLLGIDVKEDVLGKTTCVFQDEETVELCYINKTKTDEFLDINYNNPSKKRRYAHTLYLNCINDEDYKINFKKENIEDKIKNKIYGKKYDMEMETISFADNTVTRGIYEMNEGTYEIVGDKIIAKMKSGYGNNLINEYYRFVDDKIIYKNNIYSFDSNLD